MAYVHLKNDKSLRSRGQPAAELGPEVGVGGSWPWGPSPRRTAPLQLVLLTCKGKGSPA